MGSDSIITNKIDVYIDGRKVGILTATQSADEPPLTFTATIWKSCKTRKRFIKLMMGVFGMPRNMAVDFAKRGVGKGYSSYMDFWADTYACYLQESFKNFAENPDRGSE